jgi:hypothetical protein
MRSRKLRLSKPRIKARLSNPQPLIQVTMEFSKVDLSRILAISHDGEYLGLVIDRDDSLELIEIPAPVAAYEGLRQLDAAITFDVDADINPLPGVPQALLMLPVDSTMANTIGYDPDQHRLQIEFKNGAQYQYEGVDRETWAELQASDSLGQFFNEKIKGYYPSQRL